MRDSDRLGGRISTWLMSNGFAWILKLRRGASSWAWTLRPAYRHADIVARLKMKGLFSGDISAFGLNSYLGWRREALLEFFASFVSPLPLEF